MKFKFNFEKLNLIYLFLMIFFSEIIFIYNFKLSSFVETGIEEDLVRLISKIHSKNQKEKLHGEENFIDIKVGNLYDIKDFLNSIENIKLKNEEEKETIKKSLDSIKIKKENAIQKMQNKLKKIQSKYDEIIDKNSILSKDLNEKKNQEVKVKSNLENYKTEIGLKNEKINSFFNNLKNTYDKKTGNFLEYEKKISSLNHILKNKNSSKNDYLQQKREQKYIDNEIILNDKLLKEEESDKKFFEVINSNISKEAKQINLSSLESNVKSQKLKKISYDNNSNLKKLDMERDQQHEYSREYNKKIKELLKSHEKIENEIKDFMIKKNKLKDEINKKKIENNLKINEQKKDLNNLKIEIKKTENDILKNIKEQKKVKI